MDAFTLFGGGSTSMVAVLVFLAAGTLAFTVMAVVRVQGSVRRRAANIGAIDAAPGSRRSLGQSGLQAAQRVVDYTAKHYASGNSEDTKVLRRRMIQAGIHHDSAIGLFFLGRALAALAVGALVYSFVPVTPHGPVHWLLSGLGGIVGYLGPSLYIDRRIKQRKLENQQGFPDFMDLLVVCADAGLSMEASLERVAGELGQSYPSLTGNIQMANLEIRAGKTMTAALEHLGDRLGLEEARSFATLITQSAELGSSITEALRVYSDDMRHQRLSRAEEKAYSLPARLALPMMICIFPVLFVVILLPVFVRLYLGHY
jgi:tight adherence protein C